MWQPLWPDSGRTGASPWTRSTGRSSPPSPTSSWAPGFCSRHSPPWSSTITGRNTQRMRIEDDQCFEGAAPAIAVEKPTKLVNY